MSYFLDGAHTPESMLTCANWFTRAAGRDAPASSASPALQLQLPSQRVLVFNCTKVLASDRTRHHSTSGMEPASDSLPFVVTHRKHARVSKQDRDPATLLPVLAKSLHEQSMLPHHAMFVPPDSSYTSLARGKDRAVDLSWQQQQRDAWESQLSALGALQVSIGAARLRPSLLCCDSTLGLLCPTNIAVQRLDAVCHGHTCHSTHVVPVE